MIIEKKTLKCCWNVYSHLAHCIEQLRRVRKDFVKSGIRGAGGEHKTTVGAVTVVICRKSWLDIVLDRIDRLRFPPSQQMSRRNLQRKVLFRVRARSAKMAAAE